MHSIAVPTDPQRSDTGVTGASMPPIRCYRRVPVEVHKADPDAPEVARRLIALIATRWPATSHAASTRTRTWTGPTDWPHDPLHPRC